MNDVPKPQISPAFTLEDIRKIRDWHYEKYKDMTSQEICEDIRKGAERFLSTPVDPSVEAEVKRQRKSDIHNSCQGTS